VPAARRYDRGPGDRPAGRARLPRYLTALHNLVTGKSSTATQVIAVAVFVVIDFLLIIIPFAFLELRPEATKALLKHTQAWLLGHAVQLMAAIALLLGAYLAVSGLVRLS
jgi:hypothetical protein